jgi:hypothetical protein
MIVQNGGLTRLAAGMTLYLGERSPNIQMPVPLELTCVSC